MHRGRRFCRVRPCRNACSLCRHCRRVYKAINYTYNAVEACKVVLLTKKTTNAQRKTLDKELRVQAALKHTNVIALIDKLVIEPETDPRFISGVYMLMELAHGGDLFDKIG